MKHFIYPYEVARFIKTYIQNKHILIPMNFVYASHVAVIRSIYPCKSEETGAKRRTPTRKAMTATFLRYLPGVSL